MTTRRAKMQVSMAPQEYDAIYRYCESVKIKPSKFLRETALAEIERKMRLVFAGDCLGIRGIRPENVTLVERLEMLKALV